MSGAHHIPGSNRGATRQAAVEYLSPDDVCAFRCAILAAGSVLSGLLGSEFPPAEPVSNALYAVTKVVGMYGLQGKWVTSRASSARSEFLVTSEVREVSAGVPFLMHASFSFSSHFFYSDYSAGGDRRCGEVLRVP